MGHARTDAEAARLARDDPGRDRPRCVRLGRLARGVRPRRAADREAVFGLRPGARAVRARAEHRLRAGAAGGAGRPAAAGSRGHARAAARRTLRRRAATKAISRPVAPATAKLSCVPPTAQSQPASRRPSDAESSAPMSAPPPKQAERMPKTSGPVFNVSDASSGRITWKLNPTVLT